jgi:hypothetical protein
LKALTFDKPTDLMGKSLKVYLKLGGAFYFKVNGAGIDYIVGFDDEYNHLRISLNDINFVVE